MRRADIVERYQRASANRQTVIHDTKDTSVVYCACGKSMKRAEYASHRQLHELAIPKATYQLTMPYRIVNGRIGRGAKHIHLLLIYSTMQSDDYPSGRALLTDYNALNLYDWMTITDSNETSVRWSKKSNKFIRTLW